MTASHKKGVPARLRNRTVAERKCAHCGTLFYIEVAFLKNAEKRGRRAGVFCSVECKDHGAKRPGSKGVGKCAKCGGRFTFYYSTARHLGPRKYCSHECAGVRAERLSLSCLECGSEFTTIPSRRNRKYCSIPCKNTHEGRERAKRNRTARTRLQSKEWQRIRRSALERDGHACVECGAKGRLHVHHLTPWRDSGDDRLDNLTTLCGSCHMKAEMATNPRHRHYSPSSG